MSIGTMGERSLHASLKEWYAQPGDQLEVEVEGYHVDVVRDDLLIEIQTRNFSAIKRKLSALAEEHPIRLVYPIPGEKWIVRVACDGLTRLGRRKSPLRGTALDVFEELVYCPELMSQPNISLDVLLTREDEVRRVVSRRWRRRKAWRAFDRRLLDVVESTVFEEPTDFCRLLPADLKGPFTNRDLAEALNRPRRLAEKMTYCLRKMGALEVVGKRRNALLHARTGQG
jgi:hypothetical protein